MRGEVLEVIDSRKLQICRLYPWSRRSFFCRIGYQWRNLGFSMKTGSGCYWRAFGALLQRRKQLLVSSFLLEYIVYSTDFQSATLFSVRFLYEGSAHPQTMQTLLGEIGRRGGGDNLLEREGYVVSAGFPLGLVALGRGLDAIGFIDTLVGRLFQYAGSKEFHHKDPISPNGSMEDHNRGSGQMMDGTQINIDVTTGGGGVLVTGGGVVAAAGGGGAAAARIS
ncbi:hypothetical protein Lser_V15G13811 [Lactuca serriola]